MKNILRSTYLWSQDSDTDWYRNSRELPADYYRLVLTWSGGWSSRLSRFLFAACTLTRWGTPSFFVMTGEEDRGLTYNEKLQVILGGVILNIMSPKRIILKVFYLLSGRNPFCMFSIIGG